MKRAKNLVLLPPKFESLCHVKNKVKIKLIIKFSIHLLKLSRLLLLNWSTLLELPRLLHRDTLLLQRYLLLLELTRVYRKAGRLSGLHWRRLLRVVGRLTRDGPWHTT